jgi:hypothetical protein
MRRLLEIVNYACVCGHPKRQHGGDDYSEWCMKSISYDIRNGYNIEACGCIQFKLDNLRYLEQKDKEMELRNND